MATAADAKDAEAMDMDHSKPEVSKSLMEIWKLQQEIVASLVQVDADPSIDTTTVPDNPLFHVIKDDHQDVYSFSNRLELYGGVDVSFPEKEGDDAVAVYVIIDKRTMTCVYRDHQYFSLEVPYVPTFLAFREIEPLQKLVHQQVQNYTDLTPKAILVDGNGILHPRHAGIACFLGTRTNIPTIGIGKSLLYEGGWTRENLTIAIDDFLQNIHDAIEHNTHTLAPQLSHVRGTIVQRTSTDPTHMNCERSPATTAAKTFQRVDRKELLKQFSPFCNGIAIPLKSDGDSRFPILGYAMVGHGGDFASNSDKKQPQSGTVKPIFVSVGHRISLIEAVKVTAALSQHRIPEPVRVADLYGRELMRSKQQGGVGGSSTAANLNMGNLQQDDIIMGDSPKGAVTS